jgi:hypothetical protein
MSTRNIVLILVFVTLLGLSVYFVVDWFRPADIQIVHTIRPNPRAQQADRPARRMGPARWPYLVSFALDRPVRLKEVRVVPTSTLATNKYASGLWHLVSDSNSVPVRAIVYGQPIRGMRPKVPGAWADPLQPQTDYTLLLESDQGRARYDFRTPATLPVPR